MRVKRACTLLVSGVLIFCNIFLAGCSTRTQSAQGTSPTAQTALNRYSGSFLDVFDTVTRVIVYGENEAAAQSLVQGVHDELLAYHQLFDIYNSYEGINNLCTVNSMAGVAPVEVDARILDLLEYAKELYTQSGGKLNIAMGSVLSVWHEYREAGIEDPEHAQLPPTETLFAAAQHTDINDVILDRDAGTVYLADPDMSLDVGAIAKGYAGQQVMDAMRAAGVSSMLLSIGGNVCAIGRRADGEDWKVAVQSPDMKNDLCLLNVNGLCLVTSGTYQRYYTVDGKRYHHIIDPDTLMPAIYFDSVSVLCADSGMADALSTTLSVLTFEEGLSMVESLADTEAMWLDQEGNITYSSGFTAFLTEQ